MQICRNRGVQWRDQQVRAESPWAAGGLDENHDRKSALPLCLRWLVRAAAPAACHGRCILF